MPLTADDLLARHKASQSAHQPLPFFSELIAAEKLPRILIITCADPRCVPEFIFRIQPHDTIVLRVAGGNAQYVLPHLLSLDSMVEFTDLLVVQHTDCGATHFRDDPVKEGLKKQAPGKETEIDNMTFGQILGSLDDNVKKSIDFLRDSPFIRDELKSKIRGFVFDIKTGDLKEVSYP
ncbi:carbonic anhydrase [Rhizodiscina lignyota]|uniref:Carbonic anhydrase n=1 Tax=Rhizodiscina lignyota TaxID=1504668 RepID=A0A9P4M0J1_9PEZI|nr:carbonic anhydrase [Rhizodiscina lignyota]